MDLFSIVSEENHYETSTFASATQNGTFSTSATTTNSLRYISISFYKIFTISLIAFTLIIIAILFFISKRFKKMWCKFSSCQMSVDETYITVPSEESVERVNRGYGSHSPPSTGELNSILDIPSNTSVVQDTWNDSEYDNLSLNPTLNDNDVLDEPPDYEYPPPYESPSTTGIKNNTLKV